MNSKDFKPGDILRATHRELKKGYHPIIYIIGNSNRDFIGAMITHLPDKVRNIKMDESHFVPGYEKVYNNTYLVKGRFIKPEEWGPFEKIGELTAAGLEFVYDITNGLQKETFAHYFYRLSK